jgi:non-specific serine/threonine protein kinase
LLLDEKKLKKFAGPRSWERGIRYYETGRVKLEEVTHSNIFARVKGSRLYNVTFNKKGENWFAVCNCPYDWGGTCKHIVATGLATNEHFQKVEEANARLKSQQKKQQSLFSVFQLEKLNKGEIEKKKNLRLVFNFYQTDFRWNLIPVFRYLKKDGKFGREMSASFYKLDNGNVNFTSQEKIALRYLDDFSYSPFYQNPQVQFDFGTDLGHILKMLKRSLIFDKNSGREISFYPNALETRFTLDKGRGKSHKNDFILSAHLWDGDKHFDILTPRYRILTGGYVFLLQDVTIFEVAGTFNAHLLKPFLEQKEVVVTKSELSPFMQKIYPELTKNGSLVSLPETISLNRIDGLTSKKLFMSENDGNLNIEIKFEYGGKHLVSFSEKGNFIFKEEAGIFVQINRQEAVEQKCLNKIKEYSLSESGSILTLTRKRNPIEWLFEDLPKITALGYEIYGEENLDRLKVRRAQPTIITQVSTKQDWFDLKMELEFDGIRVSVEEILRKFKKNKKYFRLDDGYVVKIDDKILKKIGLTGAFGSKAQQGENTRRFTKNQVLILDDILDSSDSVKVDKKFTDQLKKIKSFEKIKSIALPPGFKGILRHYQKSGYDWLHFLKDYGFGGCLADDMGLGKTAQSLAFIESIKKEAKGKPSLVVAPTSVMFNWGREIEKFTPGLRYHVHFGPNRQKETTAILNTDIFLTSYAILRRDIDLFLKIKFFYVILDESQNIKNPSSLTARSAYKLNSTHRLALTGTPLENNLSELWSQFNFLNPGMVGGLSSFQEYFARPIERDGDLVKAGKLKKIIYPFVLRRKKGDVVKELPPKIETVSYCEMDENQQKVYDKWRDYYRAEILGQIETAGLNKSKMKVLEGLTRLRQISIHPGLVETDKEMTSGKFTALMENLQEVISENHKILVFSQFVKALSLVRKQLDTLGIGYAYLDGRTKKRAEQVDKFQKDESCKLFLISLKAGGTGLNLTEAEYVFHLDPWWNPAVEMQASDRAHRIGQTKQVFVYKMISRNTVEEKILILQEKKRKLVNDVISTDTAFFKTLKKEDIEGLFS